MDEASGIFINVVSTGGSTANIYNIDDTVNQLGTVQSDVMSYAWDGIKSFEKDGKIHSFRTLGGLYEEAVQIVTMDEDIKTVAATDPMNTLDGKAIEAPLENRYDVIITVKTTAVRHETGNLMVGKVKLVEGVQFRAATLLANCQAKVQNLQWN
jgi:hypothetical protein